ncbi:hypothetical protein INT48_004935 [Thamnidium elegans]|uniref:Uncharacterized protein n=1 Tax=Thamnidium elegans TaxID=101142 RepID=A0A8H7SFH2_9FUNG|nr:hypothetical protein INT48_004935 [Thamnidium elegans]
MSPLQLREKFAEGLSRMIVENHDGLDDDTFPGYCYKLSTSLLKTRLFSVMIKTNYGQERFQSSCVAYYRGADACALVHDVNNFLSFQHLSSFCFICSSLPTEEARHFPLQMIGNKINVDDRVVLRRQARAWAEIHSSDKMQILCFEASAKNRDNVEKTFTHIAKMAKIPQMELYMVDNNSFSLTVDSRSIKSRCY